MRVLIAEDGTEAAQRNEESGKKRGSFRFTTSFSVMTIMCLLLLDDLYCTEHIIVR